MERVNIGVIGLGQRGSGLLDTILAIKEARVVAVSDIYEDRRAAAAEKVEKKIRRKTRRLRRLPRNAER